MVSSEQALKDERWATINTLTLTIPDSHSNYRVRDCHAFSKLIVCIEKWEYLQRKAHIKFCWDVIIQGIYMDIESDIKQTWTWICLWTWVCLTKKQVALWKPARNFDCGNLGSSHADRPIYFSPTLLHLNVLPSKRSPSSSTHTCY